MGFWDSILGRPQPVAVFTPNIEYIGGNDELAAYYGGDLRNASVDSLWRTQPHLRTVVTFLARNVAQLGVHTFERLDETDRRRDRSSAAAKALSMPDVGMTGYELIYALIGDICLYDRAYWFVGPSLATRSGFMLRRLPPAWVSPVMADPFTVQAYRVNLGSGKTVDVPSEQILPFTGYSPTSPSKGSPTVEALKDTLQEQVESSRYRSQVWKRGGRVSSVLERPANAPKWGDAAREVFREDWYAKFTGNGKGAGGTPILEDGMQLKRIDFNAKEQQFVEAAKLSLVTVASAFHVNPTMIGQNDGANYSNVREFRRMLYGDTLGPTLAQVEARLNTFLLPMLGMDQDRFYVEFNIAEKLQGSFEEQAAAMQTATGAPWMLRSEARARMNLPAIPDADSLVIPLNVLTGGQASPADSAPKAARRELSTKAAATDPERAKAEQVFQAFFKRQRRVVLGALGSKAGDDWWDAERWYAELSDDLLALGLHVSKEAALRAIKAAGGDESSYDQARTIAYLRAVSDRTAKAVNDTTKAQLDEALQSEDGDPVDVYDVAQGSRSAQAALTLTTALASFGTVEAGKQSGAATKTWITGPNARASHAAMSGETVAISENFSNGMAWPGDDSDADEVAGCNCSVQFDYP